MDDLLKSLVKTSKHAQTINYAELSFYRASDPMNATRFDALNEELLQLSNLLLGYAADTTLNPDISQVAFTNKSLAQFSDNFADVTEITDNLLDAANILIDESLGRNKRTKQLNSQPLPNNEYEHVQPKSTMRKANILKPQQRFAVKIDNSNSPFLHSIAVKLNARVALDAVLDSDMSEHLDSLGALTTYANNFLLMIRRIAHPYQFEIDNIVYPDFLSSVTEEVMSGDFLTTPFTWVDTDAAFSSLLAHLTTVTEIAVDLEHHDYRTFQGLVCLIQISTRTQDFIIDPFPLRASIHLLNAAFTDPAVLKVFHGAESDIHWLQRDFGVYVVGMFDTYHASHMLEMPHHGLGYLLQDLVGVETDKKYQLADWRIRPLSEEMMRYARMDTHYLLEIYDKMRNCLIENESTGTLTDSNSMTDLDNEPLLKTTLDRSARTTLKLYQKEIYQENGNGSQGYLQTLQKALRPLTSTQYEIYKALHALRDQLARTHDESLRYVMPNHVLFNLAIRAPHDEAGVLGACNPPTQMVRQYCAKILEGVEFGTSRAREIEVKANEERADDVLNMRLPVSAHGEHGGVGKHVRFAGVGEITEADSIDKMKVEVTTVVEESKKRKIGNVIDIAVKKSSMFGSEDESDDEAALRSIKLAEDIKRNLVLMTPQMIPKAVEPAVIIVTPTPAPTPQIFILSHRANQKASSNDPLDLDAWMRNESKVSLPTRAVKDVTPHDFAHGEEEMNALFMQKAGDKDSRNARTTFNPFVDSFDPDEKKYKKEKLKKLPKLTNKPRSGNKTSTM